MSRIRRDDAADQFVVGLVISHRLARVKSSVAEELPGRAGNDETVLSISRFRVPFVWRPIAVCIIRVFPKQLVGISEGVLVEIETPNGGGVGRGRTVPNQLQR